jgi:cell division septation protein DedD
MAFLVPDKLYTRYGVPTSEYFLTTHNPNGIQLPGKRTDTFLGVSLHNTNDINAAKGTSDAEQHVRATVNGAMGSVVPYAYIDYEGVWVMLPENQRTWCNGVSSTKIKKVLTAAQSTSIGNNQTLSIECIMIADPVNTKTGAMVMVDGVKKPYDDTLRARDKKAADNTARHIAYIFNKYGFNVEKNLYSHNYWGNMIQGRTGTMDYMNTTPDGYKGCPAFIRLWWADFKKLVTKYQNEFKSSASIGSTEKIQTATDTTNAKEALYRVQVGSFEKPAGANVFLNEVESKGYKPFVTNAIVDGKKYYRVQVGAFKVKTNALAYAAGIKALGYSPFVLQV